MTRDTKAFRKNLILLIVSVVISLLIAELALRTMLPAPITWKFPQETYTYDSETRHWLTPGQQAFTHEKKVIINSIGIRDSEYPSKASSDVYRVLALGDSQTFGNGLDLKDTWPKQLENRLNKSNNNLRFEVINGGLPGSDTWQHEIILNRMISSYNPNAVVLLFYVNDVSKRPPNKTSKKTSENTQFKSRLIFAIKQSVLLLTIRQAYYAVQHALAPTKKNIRQYTLLSGEQDAVIAEGWEQVDKSLSAMKKMTNKHDIYFLIASLPRRDQVDGRLPWDAYNKRLQKIVDKHKIPMISMMPSLKEGYSEHRKDLFIPWDGHNSKIANQIIAREISNSIDTHMHNNKKKPISVINSQGL